MSEHEIFAAAIKLTGQQRMAFVQAACGGDPALGAQVEALLRAHDESGDFQLKEVDRRPEETKSVAVESAPGTLIAGRYKLIEAIGEGGMGSVWLAEQKEPVKRKVAVKLIKAGMDSKSVLARFEAERQALALMDHPNIAKVFDGGMTEQGRPFFAMELVKGIPLTEYCDQVQHSVRERLELFGQVCSAVQHAHQKGIIHRDLKPTNILVTEQDGRPVCKVIDFGLAKALHGTQALTDLSLHTSFGAVVGTPLYMAPEQLGASALDVDTRADLYSLGVILYELVTGTTPIERQRLKEAAWDEIRRMVREEDPPKPSTRLSSSEALPNLAARRHADPGRLTGLVRGDLDWIVMKALEKDRSRRYETASGLALDIQRHLAGDAVLAAPPSRLYRLRKFVRRHRQMVTAASLGLLALVAGIVGTTCGLFEAQRQMAIAQKQETEAKRQAQIAKMESVAKEQARAAEADARQKAEAAKVVAQAKEAEANAIVRFFEEKVFAAARPKGQAGGRGAAVTVLDAVRASLPALGTSFRDQPIVEARLRYTLGATLHYLGEYAAAAEQIEQALALSTHHLGSDHADTLKCMNNLAATYIELFRHTEALKLNEETLAARRRTLPPNHPDTLLSMNNVAYGYTLLNRHDDAIKLYSEALAAQRRVLPPDHADTLRTMNNLAISYALLNRHDEARILLEDALAAEKRVFPPDHPDTLLTLRILANCYAALNRHGDALELREQTLDAHRRVLPPNHPETLRSMHNLAHSYHDLNRPAEALKLREEVLEIRRRVLPQDHPETLVSLVTLASSLVDADRGAEAIPLIDEFLLKSDRPDVDFGLVRRAINLRLGHFRKAGDPAGCRGTAEMWEKLNRTDASSLYNAACYRALTAEVQEMASGDEAPVVAQADADQAMEWLRRAVNAGWTDAVQLREDSDLTSLRDRQDFKALLADLEQ